MSKIKSSKTNTEEMFNLIGYDEHAGSGVPDIYSTWEIAGYRMPIVEEEFGNDRPNRTILTLPLVERTDDLALFEKGPEKGPEKNWMKNTEKWSLGDLKF